MHVYCIDMALKSCWPCLPRSDCAGFISSISEFILWLPWIYFVAVDTRPKMMLRLWVVVICHEQEPTSWQEGRGSRFRKTRARQETECSRLWARVGYGLDYSPCNGQLSSCGPACNPYSLLRAAVSNYLTGTLGAPCWRRRALLEDPGEDLVHCTLNCSNKLILDTSS